MRYLFIVLACLGCTSANSGHPVKVLDSPNLPRDSWPITLDAAAKDFLLTLTPEDREELNYGIDDFDAFWERFGPYTRNRYGLWRGNELLIKDTANPKSAAFAVIMRARELLHQQVELEDWMLGPDRWPNTLDAAAKDLIDWITPEDRETLRKATEDSLYGFHFGLGMGIRNRQGLWRGNTALILDALGGEEGHPDDASHCIIVRAWQMLQEQ